MKKLKGDTKDILGLLNKVGLYIPDTKTHLRYDNIMLDFINLLIKNGVESDYLNEMESGYFWFSVTGYNHYDIYNSVIPEGNNDFLQDGWIACGLSGSRMENNIRVYWSQTHGFWKFPGIEHHKK